MLMRAPAGMTSLHSGHEKVDEASGRTVSTQRAHSSWLPSQGMILGSRSSSSKGSKHTGHSRALMTDPVSARVPSSTRFLLLVHIPELFACKFSQTAGSSNDSCRATTFTLEYR